MGETSIGYFQTAYSHISYPDRTVVNKLANYGKDGS